MMRKIKKLTSAVLLGAVLFGNALAVHADTGVATWMSWHVYSSGSGVVDGSKNGAYYTLTPGNVHLDITSLSGKGTKDLELRRKAGLLTYGSGSYSISENGIGKYQWNISTSSSYYYYVASGGNADSDQSIEGITHDHGI
jgi:hypothetical protein